MRALLLPGLLLAACDMVGTQQGYEPPQPIAYSHALHAGELKIACMYCHSGAEYSRHAGVPSANVCMNCHKQVKADSPEVQKIAQAVATNTPIQWTRVHRYPDFAYFNHSRHVGQGVQCQACHGPVETMVRVRQVETMTMGWCIECHRTTLAEGKLKPPTDCSACHY